MLSIVDEDEGWTTVSVGVRGAQARVEGAPERKARRCDQRTKRIPVDMISLTIETHSGRDLSNSQYSGDTVY